MTRTKIVDEIITQMESLPILESDIFDFTQSWWDEAGDFWSSYYADDLTTSKALLNEGPWGDAALHRLNDQLNWFSTFIK